MYTLLSGPMVYTLFPCFARNMVYTIAFFLLCDLGVGRQTEKRGVPRWWCILFFSLQTSTLKSEVSKRGWRRGGGLATNDPQQKKQPKRSPEMCPPSP